MNVELAQKAGDILQGMENIPPEGWFWGGVCAGLGFSIDPESGRVWVFIAGLCGLVAGLATDHIGFAYMGAGLLLGMTGASVFNKIFQDKQLV